MRTMVLSTWWALMKRRIGDAMSAAVRERSRASEWVLERENPQLFLSDVFQHVMDVTCTANQLEACQLRAVFIYYLLYV